MGPVFGAPCGEPGSHACCWARQPW